MKKEGWILLVVILIFIGLIFFGMSSKSESKDTGILNNLFNIFSFKWLSEGTINGGYGICSSDEECGQSSVVEGSEFCDSDSSESNVVYGEWMDYHCENPGTIEAACVGVPTGNSAVIKQCGINQVCSEGECVYPSGLECKDENGDVITPGPCEICDYSLDVPKIVNKGDGSECNNGGKYLFGGICSNGKCVEKNCENMKDYGMKTCGDTCCEEGKTCCGGLSSSPICCDNKNEECKSTINLAGLKTIDNAYKQYSNGKIKLIDVAKRALKVNMNQDLRTYQCVPKEKSCEEKGMKLCEADLGSVCCPTEGAGSTCVYDRRDILNIRKNVLKFTGLLEDFLANMGFENKEDNKKIKGVIDKLRDKKADEIVVAICGDENGCENKEGYSKCDDLRFGEFEGGTLCCEDKTEKCVNKDPNYNPPFGEWNYFVPSCQPLSCGEGFTECVNNDFRICCKDGVETCFKDSSTSGSVGAYLRCVNVAERVENPSDTRSTSVYMVRDIDGFELNGKAYVIEPSVLFAKDVRITFNQEVLFGEDVHKYSNHEAILESCNATYIKRTEKNVGINGGEINLDEEVVMTIPNGAINKNTQFSITAYELTDCYEVGKEFRVNDLFKEKVIDYRIIGVIFAFSLIILFFVYKLFRKSFKKISKKKR